MIEVGLLAPFFRSEYLLVKTSLTELFTELGVERILIQDAVVWHRKSDVDNRQAMSLI